MILSFHRFIQEKKNPCWKGYKQIGTKKKGSRIVPNCVKVNEQQSEFDRQDFYFNYYKNLSPSDFDVEKYGDTITIKIPRKENYI